MFTKMHDAGAAIGVAIAYLLLMAAWVALGSFCGFVRGPFRLVIVRKLALTPGVDTGLWALDALDVVAVARALRCCAYGRRELRPSPLPNNQQDHGVGLGC